MSMIFNCLGTGSKGNGYLIDVDGSHILLDCGVKFEKIVGAINLNDLDCCFISHKHKDHSLNEEKLLNRGVSILKGDNDFVAHSYKDFVIYTFDVKHGDEHCNGCIVSKGNENILYITDFNLCEYDLSEFKFTTIIVECNYCEDLITEEMCEDFKIKRQINTHMGLNGLDIFINHLDLSKCSRIILCHKSTSNKIFDENEALATIYSRYRKIVGVCQHNGGVNWIGAKYE